MGLRHATPTLAALSVGALLATTGPAAAGPDVSPKVVELRVSRSRLLVVLDFQPPPGAAAQALRASFDRDRSGSLDRAEQDRLLAYLARQATLPVRVEFDGAPLTLVQVPGSVQGQNTHLPVQSPAQVSVRLELEASLPKGPGDFEGRHRLVYRDEPPGKEGRVPLNLHCSQCEITEPASGRANHGPEGDEVKGAEVRADAPFSVKLRLR
jgi:hypothetical protein